MRLLQPGIQAKCVHPSLSAAPSLRTLLLHRSLLPCHLLPLLCACCTTVALSSFSCACRMRYAAEIVAAGREGGLVQEGVSIASSRPNPCWISIHGITGQHALPQSRPIIMQTCNLSVVLISSRAMLAIFRASKACLARGMRVSWYVENSTSCLFLRPLPLETCEPGCPCCREAELTCCYGRLNTVWCLVASLTLSAALLTALQASLAACAALLLFEISRTGSYRLWRKGVALEV